MERRINSVHRSIFRIDRRIRARERFIAAIERRTNGVHLSLVDTDRLILAMDRSIARIKRCITLVQTPVSHHPPFDQKLVRGPRHVSRRGLARAIASDAAHQPSQALRPGRRRQRFSSALQRA